MMTPKFTMVAGSAVLATILIISFYGLGQSLASSGFENDDQDSEYREQDDDNDRRGAIQMNQAYVDECGSCHMAYPAMLLPEQSWRKIMAGLEDHFGENAELDGTTRTEIEKYLVRESDRQTYRKMFRNLGNATPLRITELPYFVNKHDEIPARMVAGNEKVKSLSQCNVCHRDAGRGRFDEDNVVIPGFGRWDD
jgi:hypothetical protein